MRGTPSLASPPGRELYLAIQELLNSVPSLAAQPADFARMWAIKWVLRLAFLALAEDRRMLPLHNEVYRLSYSLSHLWESLRQQHQQDASALTGSRWGFSRLQSLCRLVRQGASHPALTLGGYGGDFFQEAPDSPAPAVETPESSAPLPDESGWLPHSARGHQADDASLFRLLGILLHPRMLLQSSHPHSTAEIMGNLYQLLVCLEVTREDSALVVRRNEAVRRTQGTYYTPVALVRPLVQQTLEPLVKPDGIPALPERILSLRLLDPAAGSGTFLVEALQYLADSLAQSLLHHGRATPVEAPSGPWRVVLGPTLSLELPCAPTTSSGRKRLLVHLKRFIAERCLHGIDMDPVAIEVARLGLWLETVDPGLPFTFLDHAVKVGNSLVGTPLSCSWRYPVAAALASIQEHPVASERQQRRARLLRQARLMQQNAVTPSLPGLEGPANLSKLRRKLAQTLQRIHDMVDELPEAKKRKYDQAFCQCPEALSLRQRLDSWCAIWFWPPQHLEALPTPEQWMAGHAPSDPLVQSVASRWRFFHWEWEFPDVFSGRSAGFDAILANPPWERATSLVPSTRQTSPLRRFTENSACPGGPLQPLYDRLSREATPAAALYQWQGEGDVNLYQLFLERSVRWLAPGGRLGLLIPSGFASDSNAAALRQALFREMDVEWLVGVSNRRKLFEIDGRFGFLAVVAAKGGPTRTFKTASGQGDLGLLVDPNATPARVAPADLPSGSRSSMVLPECTEPAELELLGQLLRNPAMSDRSASGFGLAYRRELDMTSSAGRFRPVWNMEEQGFFADTQGAWSHPSGQTALPLIQGATFRAYAPWSNRWEGGQEGRWVPTTDPNAPPRPKYLVPCDLPTAGLTGFKLVMRRLARNSDERTLQACVMPAFPCGDKAPTLIARDTQQMLAACALVNSLTLDWVCRSVSSGTNVDWHRVSTLPLPPVATPNLLEFLPPLVVALHPMHPLYRPLWESLALSLPWLSQRTPAEWAANSPAARRLLQAALDAHVAQFYGLSPSSFALVVSQCQHPIERLALPSFTRTLPQRGFWRVDKTLPPAQRRPNLALRWLSNPSLMALSASEVLLRCREATSWWESWEPAPLRPW